MNLCVTSFLWETKISVSCFTRGKSFAICEEVVLILILLLMMVSSIDKCSRSRTAVLPNLTRAETFLRLKRETNKQNYQEIALY